jgi:hypothetical protein
MFGAPGQFSALLNKQKNEKHRKTSVRYKLQKKKENFLKEHPADVKTELEFPEVSQQKLERIKNEIRRKAKIEQYIKIGTYLLGIVIFFVLFLYWLGSN